MWWRDLRQWRARGWAARLAGVLAAARTAARRRPAPPCPARLAVVLAAAGLTAGCWQPLYGARPPGGEGVQDKFAAVDIPPIKAPKGTPAERVAISMRNALQFDLHNGAGNSLAPAFALRVNVGTSQFTAYLDPTTGRPDTQIENVIAIYQLVALPTG